MESVQLHSLITAVSHLSDENLQKILQNRNIQLEKTRLSEYLAACDAPNLKKAESKVRVTSAYTSTVPGRGEPSHFYGHRLERQGFWRSYMITRPEGEISLEVCSWCHRHPHPEGGSEFVFELFASYGETEGSAETACLRRGW